MLLTTALEDLEGTQTPSWNIGIGIQGLPRGSSRFCSQTGPVWPRGGGRPWLFSSDSVKLVLRLFEEQILCAVPGIGCALGPPAAAREKAQGKQN